MKNLFTILILIPFISNAQPLQKLITTQIKQVVVKADSKQTTGNLIGGLNRENPEIVEINTTYVKIIGPNNICSFITNSSTATYTINKSLNVAVYNWEVPTGAFITSHPGGTGVNDTIIMVSFTNSFVDLSYIKVNFLSFLGRLVEGFTLITKKQPQFPQAISGPANVCSFIPSPSNIPVTQALYSINKVDFSMSYNWEIPVGAVIESHPGGFGENDTCILVSFNSQFNTSGFIKVSAANDCGKSGTRTLNVKTILPKMPEMIYGPINACNNIFQEPILHSLLIGCHLQIVTNGLYQILLMFILFHIPVLVKMTRQ